MKEITFVRHAETVSSGAEDASDADEDLNETGKRQALQFAETYHQAPDLIISSPYRRAKETARPLAEKFPGIASEVWQDLHEFNYIESGLTAEDRKRRKADFWTREDPEYRSHESAENFSEFVSRIDNVLDELTKTDAGSVAVFAHAKFMRTLVLRLINSKTISHTNLMAQLLSYKLRFKHCDTLTILTDEDGATYIKSLSQ